MKDYFFILGLPRTRTSWLANFFTHTDSFCYHEALKFCTSVQDLKKLLDAHKEQHVGNADCSMINYYQDIAGAFPGARYILVERKPAEVVESLLDFQLMEDYEITENWVDKLQHQIEHVKEQGNFLSVSYRDLDDMDVCKELWNYVMPEMAFNEKRWHLLDELYVNILIGKSYQRMIPESLFGKFSNRRHITRHYNEE